MKYDFYFSPEGRKVATIEAKRLDIAKAKFYRANPKYRKANATDISNSGMDDILDTEQR